MAERTQAEIDTMIQRLKDSKETLPEFSIFGDNNWQGIDDMIAVLNHEYTSADDIYEDEEERGRERTSEMLLAFDWMNGEVSDDELL